MPVTREQFETGLTYDAYKAQMTRNREQVEQNEKDLLLTSDDDVNALATMLLTDAVETAERPRRSPVLAFLLVAVAFPRSPCPRTPADGRRVWASSAE